MMAAQTAQQFATQQEATAIDEAKRRDRCVQQAIANQELEGNILDEETIQDGYAMLAGAMTIEEMIARAVQRPT